MRLSPCTPALHSIIRRNFDSRSSCSLSSRMLRVPRLAVRTLGSMAASTSSAGAAPAFVLTFQSSHDRSVALASLALNAQAWHRRAYRLDLGLEQLEHRRIGAGRSRRRCACPDRSSSATPPPRASSCARRSRPRRAPVCAICPACEKRSSPSVASSTASSMFRPPMTSRGY